MVNDQTAAKMETEIPPSQLMADMSLKGDDGDARFISSSSPGSSSPTLCGIAASRASPTLSKSAASKEEAGNKRYLSEEELNDFDLAYPLVPNPHHRKNPRGICLLINQRDFDLAKTGQERRDGTDVDADMVERTFIRCGYAVERATNLTLRKMELLLDDVSSQNHSIYDSFVCVVLSHGSDGVIYAADGIIPADKFVSYFRSDRCPSLAGKPKIFFIQACRGSRFDPGVTMSTDAGEGGVLITKLPVEADIFVANSTAPGYFAWRNSQTGSWFIQELCAVIKAAKESGKSHDVASLLTVVARKVALLYESNTGQRNSHGMKQMVTVNSTLTRKALLV
uniref:Caspase-3-like n=1 Tax=Mesocestoides corti TaxID=53468 RepID=A0A5K3FBG3_MESCO